MTELSVLIVEDEPLVADAHRDYVGRVEGFVLAGVAGTVQAAVRALARQPIDLVLLDLNLPDGSGLEVLRGVRAAGRPVDILTITAAREFEPVRAALTLGVGGYLLKPFTFADLRDRLEAYRRYRADLAGAPSANQATVDAMFGELRRPTDPGNAPKGLDRGVLDDVIALLRDAGAAGRSASEIGVAVGLSRVTARRYLQYLTEQGRTVRSQRLGGSGRPEVLFTWRL